MAKASADPGTIYTPMVLDNADTEVFALSQEIEGAFAGFSADDEPIAASESDAPSAKPAGRDTGTGTPEASSGAETSASEKDEQETTAKAEDKLYTKEQYERARAEANRQRDKQANEARQLQAQLEQIRKDLEQARFDREVYLRATERLRARADSPDGVSYRDVDEATRASFEEVAQLKQTSVQAQQQDAAQQMQRATLQNQAIMQRDLAAASNYNKVISTLAQEAIAAQVTNLDVVALFARQADDPDIRSDIDEWRNPDISPDRAQLLIERIHRRSAAAVRSQIDSQKRLLAEARTQAASTDEAPPDRRAIHGDASGGVSPVPPMPAVWQVSAALEDAFSSAGTAR